MVHALQQSLVVYLESLKIFQYKYVDIMYLCTYVTNPIYLIVQRNAPFSVHVCIYRL